MENPFLKRGHRAMIRSHGRDGNRGKEAFQTSSSRNSMRRGQKTPICESLCAEEEAQAEGEKLRPGLLRKRHDLLCRPTRKRLTYRRFLSLASHFPSRMPAAHSETAAVAFPSCTQSAANHPREQSRAIFCNRIAFLTTPCACSPDKPRRIWKTTRGTPRNRRARRQATAGRDRRTSPP